MIAAIYGICMDASPNLTNPPTKFGTAGATIYGRNSTRYHLVDNHTINHTILLGIALKRFGI